MKELKCKKCGQVLQLDEADYANISGKTLELHCCTEFEQYIRPMMPNASFEKVNDDTDESNYYYIFRDSEYDEEYISIMFEMNSMMDTIAAKHKIDDLLKKLNDDRGKKKCVAVLVSLLEDDNGLYKNGIVNMSHLYPNMYVIRPQFFVLFIKRLVQSMEYKKKLILAKKGKCVLITTI